MIERIIRYSLSHKLIIGLFTLGLLSFGLYALFNISIGAVPDITNNQVQVITTSQNLATQDVEKYLTYPVELEMANLPGVTEIRSVSKFGLSVVTIVFDDDMGTYLPRQLIAEKIKSAETQIPSGFGTPEMGPVSTGLGEIYQYILDVDPAYKDRYSIMDLRSIQDWVVKRQFSGIEGVVEVNTWGGFLKQYEVAINPHKLRALNIGLNQVYEALKSNNQIAGGGYIEKEKETYFIRADGLMNTLDDIRNVVITKRDDVPVFVRDVATVGFGHATRFGAITANGEGEKVLGQVMMLKDANSNATIKRVRERVAEIQKNLPEGVYINGFLDRNDLIEKTTFTIAENLILGFLIVILIVVLLLGNLRSGMIIASVIPLSLLFAISLMYVFGIDANLMSLGAIDFGIIIDGAVIIVEYIVYKLGKEFSELKQLDRQQRRKAIDRITFTSTSRLMRSALFGQIIIIIVFIPILTLTGIEGKLFTPMALVFSFALTGTMIFGFTYVPVVASLILVPTNPKKTGFSKRIIERIENSYLPVLKWALRHKKAVISMSFAGVVGAALLFLTMGGEFIPTLDEGDFVIQPVLETGTSLTETIKITTRIEKIIKKFPEVKDVITRIGAAEIPTDPMSMEETDVIITLLPKNTWVTANSKDQLADSLKAALQEIPGMDYEFTQPIEMRFNELITGIRADLAIKVYGEDHEVLYQTANKIKNAITNVEGASDITVEKIQGLPQVLIKYDRQKIAKYGLDMQEVSQIITAGFGGLKAGSIFESERQYDLVLRFDEKFRSNIDNIKSTTLQLPNGSVMPLSTFASVEITKGPAKISRDDTKRRIVIGINVRNRDLQSVVQDIQQIISSQITMPVGYRVSYGGQFENLERAKARLIVAVPVALLLIFIMLYFTFGTLIDAILIYTAIPLAAVGGVLILYLRDLPFSISAGIGFIALFGIAVLNGIVLIEHFKTLRQKDHQSINQLIIQGTRDRLRPVLLTAGAAIMGFIPMAVSSSAGAEVQRPLASVVVGGLLSATFLTLIVLPVLYAWVDRYRKSGSKKRIATDLLIFILPLLTLSAHAQTKELSMDDAIKIALQNNAGLKASADRVSMGEADIGSYLNLDKTEFYYYYDENNIAFNGRPLNVWGVSQRFDFPTVYTSQRKINLMQLKIKENEFTIDQRKVIQEVSKAYVEVVYWQSVAKNYSYLDSLYQRFAYSVSRKFEEGESNHLEKLTAESKRKEIEVLKFQTDENIKKSYIQLKQWVQLDSSYLVSSEPMTKLEWKPLDTLDHPGLNYYRTSQILATDTWKNQKQRLWPQINVSYFQGSNQSPNALIYRGFQAGVSVPLFYGAQKSKIEVQKIQMEALSHEAFNYKQVLYAKYHQLIAEKDKYELALNYFDESGRELARAILLTTEKSFAQGDIDFYQYILSLENAQKLFMTYLDNLYQYNLTVLELNFLIQ